MDTIITQFNASEKVAILSEALPYIREFSGATLVIKYGGNAMTDEDLKIGFAKDIALLKLVGMNPVVVHGGGPQINHALERLGLEGKFIQGMRVTDEQTMQVVEMVLGGAVNKEIASLLNQYGAKAVGITGKDGHFIQAKKMLVPVPGQKPADIGQVGEIESIDTSLINILLTEGFIPVIAPIGVGQDGETYNINADVVAGQLAQTLKAEKLIMMTNTQGVLNQKGELLSKLSTKDIDTLCESGVISGGMLPKISSALDAAKNGANNVHIIDGRLKHALLLEIFTHEGVGTMITSK